MKRSEEKLNLVIDQGGHATRAIVFDAAGKMISQCESEIGTLKTGELIVEHDPIELTNSVDQVLEKTLARLGARHTHLESAGLATQRSSFVCWRKSTGEALTPVISWQDRRSVNLIDRYQNQKESIHKKTGLYLNPHYGATKMRWCLEEYSQLAMSVSKGDLCIAPLASFLVFHMLIDNPFVVDPANASRTLLMDSNRLTWDDDLLKLFEIPRSVLPEINPTQSHFGELPIGKKTIPLSVCTGDQSAAIYSHGQPDENKIYVNAGTGAFVQKACAQQPKLANEKLLASIVRTSTKSRTYVFEGTVNGAGSALEWLSKETDLIDYQSHLNQWCEDVEPGGFFINAVSGVGSPFWIADLKSYFVNCSGSEKEKFVAVIESIVFLIYRNIQSINQLSEESNGIQISGGIAQNNYFCQKLADLSKLKTLRYENSEATARGVSYLLTSSSDSTLERLDEFIPENNKKLHCRYRDWLSEMRRVTS